MPRLSRLPLLAAAWCAAYSLLHVWWAVFGAPAFPYGESPLPGGWLPVALSVAAVVGCLLARRWGPWALVPAAVGGIGLVAYSMLAWIDLVMVLMVPFGLPMAAGEVGAAAVRVAGAVGGGLALAVAWSARPALRVGPERARSWGRVAAALAVAGLAARLGPGLPRLMERGIVGPGGAGFVVFVVLLLLAGTALPLALVVPWGRRLPRWLVLGPALFVGTGLVAYFGVGGFGAMATGRTPADPDALLMIGGYTVWGVGLLGAAAAYAAQRSRPRER
jgi:hypothetical protein